MMSKLYDSEMKVMEIIWEVGAASAKEISQIAGERLGWNKNTTYTVLKKLDAKGYITRTEPGFVCTPNLTKADAQRAEMQSHIDKFFGGSRRALFSALLEDENLTPDEIAVLRERIEKR